MKVIQESLQIFLEYTKIIKKWMISFKKQKKGSTLPFEKFRELVPSL